MNPKIKDTPLPEPGSFDDFWNDNERIVENTEEHQEYNEKMIQEHGHEAKEFEL